MVFDHIFKVIFRYFEKICGDLAINEDGQENIIPGSAHQKIVDRWAEPISFDVACMRMSQRFPQ
jgi:uncharacterized protein YaiL (DUF2058 family)